MAPAFAAVSRAPVEKIEAFRKRMGWRFTWVSSADSDFNFDFDVSFTPRQMAEGEVLYNYRLIESGSPDLPGISVFVRDEAAPSSAQRPITAAGTRCWSAPTTIWT